MADPRIRDGRAIFTTLIPNVSDPCSYGGSGWLMELDLFTGNRDDGGTFDTKWQWDRRCRRQHRFLRHRWRQDQRQWPLLRGGIPVGTTIISKPPGPPVCANGTCEPPPCTDILYVPQTDGTTVPVTQSCKTPNAGRALWREIK